MVSSPRVAPAAVVSFSSYLGGSERDFAQCIAVDASGATYVSGTSHSLDFPLQGAYQADNKGFNDAFVTKLDPSGTSLVYSTYIGGSASEGVTAIAIDATGNAHLAGHTRSSDFPLQSPIQSSLGKDQDAFVLKLSADGASLIYSTYLGGSAGLASEFDAGKDYARAIALDALGNVYVAGVTASTDFPTKNAVQTAYMTGNDAWVSELLPDGSGFVFSTYLGGSRSDGAEGIAVDDGGRILVTGGTNSMDFPVVGGFQQLIGGKKDGFLVKLSPGGAGRVYASFFGGVDDELGYAVAVDAGGSAFVAGSGISPDFPLVRPLQAVASGPSDAIVLAASPDGSTLLFSSYLGGTGDDKASGVALDGTGHVWLTGHTSSTDFPAVGAFQVVNRGGRYDAFIAELDLGAPAILYSTYLGGTLEDAGFGITVGPDGSVAACGLTVSTDFPGVCPFQGTFGGGDWWGDAFVVRLDGPGPRPVADGAVVCGTKTVTLDASGSTGCPAYVFTWLEGTTPVCPSAPTCDVTPAMTTTYTLEAACAGAPGCAVSLPVVVTVQLDVRPGDLGNSLRAVRSGADVVLTWGIDAAAVTYSLYRGVAKDAWPALPLLGGLASPAATLPDVPPLEPFYLYRAAGASCSGLEGP